MKLNIVMFVLMMKMRIASRKNDLFRKRLLTRTGSIIIKTADNRQGRLFVFSKGHFLSRSTMSGEADVKMIWKDPTTAFKAMTSNDSLAVTKAMQTGEVVVEGDLSIAQWFNLLVKAVKGDNTSIAAKSGLKVAVIGLGKMGSGIAANIQNAGYDLVVYNRTKSKVEPFVEKGASSAESPAEAASQAQIVITSLMDDDSIRNMVVSENGILAGLQKGGIHLCATTISPDLATELAETHRNHGSSFVSGAVVGRPDAAAAGELLTLMAGPVECLDICQRICGTYSAASLIMGEDPCLANYAKLSVNYLAISSMELMGQLYAYGDATGIGRTFFAQLLDSSFANPVLKFYAKKILNRDFDKNVGFTLSGGLKDVTLMHRASEETSKSLNYAPIIISKMEKAIAAGLEKSDWSVFTELSAIS